MTGPQLGTTIYSFTREFHGHQASMEDLVRRVAAEGLGPGLEVVGFQSFRGWPFIDDATIGRFRDLVEETGLTATSLGANSDAGVRRDRRLTDDELVEYMEAQIITAARLGFRIVRVQYSVTPDDMERLLPIAEREDVTLGIEVHAHHSPRHPVFQALRERYDKLGSPRLGFIPDWGATMTQLPPSIIKAFRARGVSEDALAAVSNGFNELLAQGPVLDDRTMPELFERFRGYVDQDGIRETANMLVSSAVGLFGRAPASDWDIVAPWSVHMHGKFYEIDEAGLEPAVPTRDILEVFVRHGYSGFISSEWEGWHWDRDSDATTLIRKHHQLVGGLIDELSANR